MNKFMVLGFESAGKTTFLSKLTKKYGVVGNYKGTTIATEEYLFDDNFTFIDTPGVLLVEDTEATKITLKELNVNDNVMIVVNAEFIDKELKSLLPLAVNKNVFIIITHIDKLTEEERKDIDNKLSDLNYGHYLINSNQFTDADRKNIIKLLDNNHTIVNEKINFDSLTFNITKKKSRFEFLDLAFIKPILSIILLVLPAVVAVNLANAFADDLHGRVEALLSPVVSLFESSHSIIQEIFIGSYGFLSMFPYLFVWAVPVVILYAFLLAIYKTSGLLDYITIGLHPLVRPLGITGRDLSPYIMGYGCNVPAILRTRACANCTRNQTISIISFGSACSYQMGATLSVFSALNMNFLAAPFVLYLLLTTILYSFFTKDKNIKTHNFDLITTDHYNLELPSFSAIWMEAKISIVQFFKKSLPIFAVISLVSSILNWVGFIEKLSFILSPLMALFKLPQQAALVVVLSSIRKDGIMLLASNDIGLSLSPAQILTGVYLAGVLLPCIVTLFTIQKELNWKIAFNTIIKQVFFALIFTLILAWVITPFLI